MDFNFISETITPTASTVLTIGSTGALLLPSGTTAQEPSVSAGALRYNSQIPQLEWYTGSVWSPFGGSVTSVNLTNGSGIGVSGGPITTSGSITVTNTGVLSFSAGSTGLTPNTATTGAVTLAGTLNLGSGGTNASLTAVAGGIVYSTSSALAIAAAGTSGYLLASGGTSAPTWTNSPAISGASITATTIPNSALVNSSVTVSPGTGMSGGGTVSLGGTITLTNAGVTSNVAGTGITVSGATGAVTIGTANIPNSSLTNSSVTIGTTSVSLGSSSTTLAGLTGITLTSGTVTGVASPVNPSDVVSLSYVQGVLAGLEWKNEAQAGTTANLTATYSNGSSGVGATLTNSGAQAAFAVDGYTASLNDRILVKNQTTQTQNGIYTVTTVGSGSTNWVLTRAIDANTPTGLNNATLYITNGTTNAGTAFTQTTATPTIGTNNIVFVQASGTGTYTAGTGLTLSTNVFSLTAVGTPGTYGSSTTVPVITTNASGQVTGVTTPSIAFPVTSVSGTGSGISVTPTTGAVVVSNTGVTSNVAGTGITVSGATGAVTITNNGVVSFSAGTTGLTPNTATTGAVTLAGTLAAGSGGTGTTTAPTAGQLLVGVTGGTYTPYTVATGTGISTTTGSGTFQINNTGVTSLAGTAGNITASASTGAVTLNLATAGTAGTYGQVTTDSFGRVTSGTTVATVTYGGTGLGTITTNGLVYGNGTSNVGVTAAGTTGQVLVGNSGSAPTWSTLTSVAVTSIAGTANQITASASTGAVTLTIPSTFTAPGSIASTSTITAATGLTLTYATANAFIYSGASSAVTSTAAATNGQLLIGSSGNPPVAATITAGTNIYVTNGAGSISIAGPKFYAESSTAPVNAPSATGNQSVAVGSGAVASLYGGFVTSAGEFTAGGDAQSGTYVLRNITTNATPALVYLDGSSVRLTLPLNSAFLFDADIVARRTDATGTFGAWNIKGLITQDATASTTTVQGTSRTFIAGTGLVLASVSATADTTNGALLFNVTGNASQTIRWVVTCRTTEVANA